MSRKFLVPIDLNKNELQNAVIQNLASAPSSPSVGQVYYDTVLLGPYSWNGTTWDKAVTVYGAVTAQTSYGAASVNGSAVSASHSDHLHGTPALSTNSPAVLTIAGASAAGAGTLPSKDDHTHAGPGFGTPTSATTFGVAAVTGVATTVLRSDHTHGTPTHVGTDHSAISHSSLALPTGNVPWGSFKITGLADPTLAQDAATKNYVDNTALGLSIVDSIKAATTTALPTGTYAAGSAGADGGTGVGATFTVSAVGILTLDGYRTLLGDRLLVKNQAAPTQNGIYTVTTAGTAGVAAILTRATDYDNHVAGQVIVGNLVYIGAGSTLTGTLWAETAIGTATTPVNGIKIGTDNITFTQFLGGAVYTASNGVLLTGNNFTFAPLTSGGLQTAAGGASVLLQTTSGLALAAGGLAVGAGAGILVAANSISVDTTIVARKYSTTLSTSATSYTVTHNLATLDVHVQVYTISDGSEIMVDNLRATTNTVTINFSVAPAINTYRVVVIG